MIPAGGWVSSAGRIQVAPCFFFFLLHHFFKPVYSATNPNYTACAPQTCGKISVNYPFSLPSQSGSVCGYPGLTLLCIDNNQTLLLLQSSTLNFTVTNIDYSNGTIDVAIEPKYIVNSGNCQYPRKNITIQDINPFFSNFNGDATTATFYYNCSTPPTDGRNGYVPGSTYNINSNVVPACSAGTQSSYIFLNGNLPPDNINMNCNSTFTFPASSTANDLATALSNGFSMNWTNDACDGCLKSGGRCGSYPDSSFVCFCQSDTHPDTCNHSRSGTKVVTGMHHILIYGSLYTQNANPHCKHQERKSSKGDRATKAWPYDGITNRHPLINVDHKKAKIKQKSDQRNGYRLSLGRKISCLTPMALHLYLTLLSSKF